MACFLALAAALCILPGQAAPQAHRHRTITQAQAERIALDKVPGGRVRSAQLQAAKGQHFWSVDVIQPGRKNAREVHVDARTGKVLAVQTERPEDQAEEPLKGR
jgi:uncharacterized membrane protein YkoI